LTRMSGAPRTSTPESPDRDALCGDRVGTTKSVVSISCSVLSDAKIFSSTLCTDTCPSPIAA
jgi:hypothetical protein